MDETTAATLDKLIDSHYSSSTLRAAVVYGSHALGRSHALSDIDTILVSGSFSPLPRYKKRWVDGVSVSTIELPYSIFKDNEILKWKYNPIQVVMISPYLTHTATMDYPSVRRNTLRHQVSQYGHMIHKGSEAIATQIFWDSIRYVRFMWIKAHIKIPLLARKIAPEVEDVLTDIGNVPPTPKITRNLRLLQKSISRAVQPIYTRRDRGPGLFVSVAKGIVPKIKALSGIVQYEIAPGVHRDFSLSQLQRMQNCSDSRFIESISQGSAARGQG